MGAHSKFSSSRWLSAGYGSLWPGACCLQSQWARRWSAPRLRMVLGHDGGTRCLRSAPWCPCTGPDGSCWRRSARSRMKALCLECIMVCFTSIFRPFIVQSQLVPSFLCLAVHRPHNRMLPAHAVFCSAGQPVAIAPQGTPHAPSSAHAGGIGKAPEPIPAQAASQSAATPAAHAHGAIPGAPEHKAAVPKGIQPDSRGLHAVQGHSGPEHDPRPTLQKGSLSGITAGQAAHTLPMAGQHEAYQTTHALPAPAHTSLPAALAHPVSLPMQPPQHRAATGPILPSGAAPMGRPGQRAEQPGVVPGPNVQHAQHAASQAPTQDAAPDSQQEATRKLLAHEGM